MMSKSLSDSTRLAIQASVAVSIAIIISYLFQMERAYWAVLTAMLLISATWGESIKKSIERVVMTIIGGLVGTGLFYLLRGSPDWFFVAILVCSFFIVYFIEVSYLISVFFITIFVVFLFAMIGHWDFKMLEARIIETIIGALIAVLVTFLVFPKREQINITDLLSSYVVSMQVVVDHAFEMALGVLQSNVVHQDREKIVKDYFSLQARMKIISYEMFFTFYPRRKLKNIIMKLGLLMHYVTSLSEISPEVYEASTLSIIQPELMLAQQKLRYNFLLLKEKLLQTPESEDLYDMNIIFDKLRVTISTALEKNQQAKSCWYNDYSFIYFMQKIDEVMLDIASFLD